MENKDGFWKVIGKTAALAAITVGGAYLIKKGIDYFSEADEMKKSYTKRTIRLFDANDKEFIILKRIKIVKRSMRSGDPEIIDSAGLLLFSTLEMHLIEFLINQKQGNVNRKSLNGLNDILRRVKHYEIMENDDIVLIKKNTKDIRNPLSHGEIYHYPLESLKSLLELTERIIDKYPATN